jgi:TetR/AcrR family transcriptional regulator
MIARASEAFAEAGYAGTSMSSVAGRIGMTKASLFHHFATKEALYLEVLAGFLDSLSAIVAETKLTEGSFPDRLDRLTTMVTDYLGSRPTAARLLLRELVDVGPFLKGPGNAAVLATMQAVASFLRAGMDAGDFREQDPEQLALTITGLHLYYFASAPATRSFLGDVFADELVDRRRAAALQQVRALCLI